jgi:60 kDa SS-A/Ro ribonucleoprotein
MSIKTAASVLSPKQTPQSRPLPGRKAEMRRNAAGGFVFKADGWIRLDRFLVLGSEANFYTSTQRMTLDNAAVVRRCLNADGQQVVQRIVEVSIAGRAPSNDPAIIALTLCSVYGDEATKHAAYLALSKVCRTGTHLFSFAELRNQLAGWGEGVQKAVGRWYAEQSPEKLALQLVKYRQRNGWTHRDLLRLSHRAGRSELLRYAATGEVDSREAPEIVIGFEKAKLAKTPKESAALIREYRLPRECVRSEHLDDPDVWAALLVDMPITAMVRNLGKMSSVGLLRPMSEAAGTVQVRLADAERLHRSRIHPMALLLAQRTYLSGHGYRGSLRWSPVQQVVDALDDAFYAAMPNVPSSGKRFLLAIDASGSMQVELSGMMISAREAAAAMALITAKREPNHYIVGYTVRPVELKISPRMRLDEATAVVTRSASGEGTDCALPVLWALHEKLHVDAICQYTDGESWAGDVHPSVALRHYRETMNSSMRCINSAFTATRGTLTDPNDPLTLDTVGLDTNSAEVIRAFASGEF